MVEGNERYGRRWEEKRNRLFGGWERTHVVSHGKQLYLWPSVLEAQKRFFIHIKSEGQKKKHVAKDREKNVYDECLSVHFTLRTVRGSSDF